MYLLMKMKEGLNEKVMILKDDRKRIKEIKQNIEKLNF